MPILQPCTGGLCGNKDPIQILGGNVTLAPVKDKRNKRAEKKYFAYTV